MQRIKIPSGIGHLLACSVIALLLCHVIFEKVNNRGKQLCFVLKQNMDRANISMQSDNRMWAKLIKVGAECYPSQTSKDYAERADILYEMKDSLIQFLELTKTSRHSQDLALIQRACHSYLAKAKSFMDGHVPSLSVLNALAFNDSISSQWPVLWRQSPESQGLVISLLQDNIHKILSTFLNYCVSKNVGYYCGTDKFIITVSMANINFTDQPYLEGDILLSLGKGDCYTRAYNNYKLFIDGKEYPTNSFSETQFSKVYEQAGTYPMHVRTEAYNCMLDSVFVSEKTYYVRVK
jgi:hypothetical protein